MLYDLSFHFSYEKRVSSLHDYDDNLVKVTQIDVCFMLKKITEGCKNCSTVGF